MSLARRLIDRWDSHLSGLFWRSRLTLSHLQRTHADRREFKLRARELETRVNVLEGALARGLAEELLEARRRRDEAVRLLKQAAEQGDGVPVAAPPPRCPACGALAMLNVPRTVTMHTWICMNGHEFSMTPGAK